MTNPQSSRRSNNRAGIVVLAALVSACAPRIDAAGPEIAAPRLADGRMTAADGAALPVRIWRPENGPARAVVLAIHGFNDYSNAFAAPAAFWAKRGIITYAYDQRGFGQAPGRGLWPGAPTMVDDAKAMAALVRGAHPGLPFYVVGLSMGGAVTILATADDTAPIDADGIVLVAPAVWGRRHMGALQRAALWLFAHTIPWYTLTGQGLHVKASDNIPMLRALGRDPLVIKQTRIDTVYGLVDLMDAAFAAAPRIGVKALVLYGRKDEIVPKGPTFEMLKRLPRGGGARIAVYDQGYHMLLRDLGADTVLADIAAWFEDPAAPLPSGADADAERLIAAD